MSRSIRLADYVVEFFAGKGTKHIFVLPGGGAMYLNDALAKSDTVEFIPNHHEQACSIAAEAYSRIDGHVGVCNVTTGPGATNALTAVAGAWIESVPMVVLSGQVKRSDLKADTGVRQKGTQEVDIVSVVKPITKYAVTIMEPNEIRHHLEKAWYLATSGRQGPVWLDFPLDVQAAMVDPDALKGYAPDTVAGNPELPAQIAKLYELINKAKRPLILAGHGIRLAGAADVFAQFYERLNIPVITTWLAMDLIPWGHQLHVGRPGVAALRPGNFAAQNCDLLIAIGARLDNVVTGYNQANFARNATKYVVDVDAHELKKFPVPLDFPICADARVFIEAALAQVSKLTPVNRDEWYERCREWKRRYPPEQPLPTSGTISNFALVQALSEEIPENTLVVTGSAGQAIEMFYMAFQNKPGQRVFLTSGLGSMGYGVPAMIGAGFASGNKPFVGVESDGSLMSNLQELLTLVEFNIPVRMFVMNNKGYASMRVTQRNYFDARYIGAGPESKLYFGDTCAIAKAMGLEAVSVSDASELREKVRYTLSRPGPIICDVEMDPKETLWPKLQAIPQADGTIISMPLEDMSPLLPRSELRENMLVPLDPASEKVNVPEKIEVR